MFVLTLYQSVCSQDLNMVVNLLIHIERACVKNSRGERAVRERNVRALSIIAGNVCCVVSSCFE